VTELNAALPRDLALDLQTALQQRLNDEAYNKIDWNKWLPIIMQILTMLLPLIVQPQPKAPA